MSILQFDLWETKVLDDNNDWRVVLVTEAKHQGKDIENIGALAITCRRRRRSHPLRNSQNCHICNNGHETFKTDFMQAHLMPFSIIIYRGYLISNSGVYLLVFSSWAFLLAGLI